MDQKHLEEALNSLVSLNIELTSDHVENRIKKVDYYIFPGTDHVVCCITLLNNFTVIGDSHHTPNNKTFNTTKHKELAREAAFKKAWQLEAYLLRNNLHAADIILGKNK